MKVLEVALKNYKDMMKYADYPDCFQNKEQFKVWSELEFIAHTKPRALPCRDCTPEYKQEMAAEGRCANAKLANVERIMQIGGKKQKIS